MMPDGDVWLDSRAALLVLREIIIFMTIVSSSVLLDTTFSRLVFFCDCYVSLQFYD